MSDDGARVAVIARRRRTLRRSGVVGGAALAAAAVVVVVATTVGGRAAQEAGAPPAPPPGSSEASVSCDDTGTVEGLPSDVTAVRLCIAAPGTDGATPRVPSDALVGAVAEEFARTILSLPKVGSLPCPLGSQPRYRFVFGYSDASRASAGLDASACQLLRIRGEDQARSGADVVETYLRLLHDQRDELGPPESPTTVDCPAKADDRGSSLGADLPQAGEPGVRATLCRYRYQADEPLLVDSVEVDDPTTAGRLAALADGPNRDPCRAIRVAPPKYDDRVLLIDAYGDVVGATAFFCAPHQVEGRSVWPGQRLQGLVDRLFRTETRG